MLFFCISGGVITAIGEGPFELAFRLKRTSCRVLLHVKGATIADVPGLLFLGLLLVRRYYTHVRLLICESRINRLLFGRDKFGPFLFLQRTTLELGQLHVDGGHTQVLLFAPDTGIFSRQFPIAEVRLEGVVTKLRLLELDESLFRLERVKSRGYNRWPHHFLRTSAPDMSLQNKFRLLALSVDQTGLEFWDALGLARAAEGEHTRLVHINLRVS